MLLNGDVEVPGTDAHGAGEIVSRNVDGLAFFRFGCWQRAFEHTAKAEGAGGDPDQLRTAAVQPQLHAVAVRNEPNQCRHRGQRLQGHYSRTISRWIWPVTIVSWSPTN